MSDEIEIGEPRYSEKSYEAVQLRLAGLSYYQIRRRLGLRSDAQARELVMDTMRAARVEDAEEMRRVENDRLDMIQARIWPKVLDGDLKAADVALKVIASRRALNGLDAPNVVTISIGIRAEMEQALAEAERIILGEVVDGNPS